MATSINNANYVMNRIPVLLLLLIINFSTNKYVLVQCRKSPSSSSSSSHRKSSSTSSRSSGSNKNKSSSSKTKKSKVSDYNSNNNLVSSSVSLSTCGNLICDREQGETTDNCAMDCQCNLNDICDDWESSNSCPLDCHCGNLICDRELGENSDNCPSDCTKGCNEMEENEMEMDGDGITMEDMNINYDMENIDMSNKDYMDMDMDMDMDIDMDHGDHHTMEMHHDHAEMSTTMMMSDIADENSPSFCHGMGMIMYMEGFQWTLKRKSSCLNFYFPSWKLDTIHKFIAAMLCVFIMAIMTEGIARLKYDISHRAKKRSTRRRHRRFISICHFIYSCTGDLPYGSLSNLFFVV